MHVSPVKAISPTGLLNKVQTPLDLNNVSTTSSTAYNSVMFL